MRLSAYRLAYRRASDWGRHTTAPYALKTGNKLKGIVLLAQSIVYIDIPGDISCNSLGLDLLIAVGSAAMCRLRLRYRDVSR